MSTVTVAEVKDFLRVFHAADDTMLQRLIDSAEDEALKYMDRSYLPTASTECEICSDDEECSDDESSEITSEDPLSPSVHTAICLLVEAQYDAQNKHDLRNAAETLLFPYRCTLGI